MNRGLGISEIEVSVSVKTVMMSKKETVDDSDRRESWGFLPHVLPRSRVPAWSGL